MIEKILSIEFVYICGPIYGPIETHVSKVILKIATGHDPQIWKYLLAAHARWYCPNSWFLQIQKINQLCKADMKINIWHNNPPKEVRLTDGEIIVFDKQGRINLKNSYSYII